MTTKYKIFMFGLAIVLVSTGVLWAEQRPREGQVRGSFLRLAERVVGEQEYPAIVIRPMEGEEEITLLLPRQREELRALAQELRPGQNVEIVYVVEDDQKWVGRIETERRPRPEEFEFVLKSDIERPRMAEQIEQMHAKIAELKEVAEQAERNGQHDRADELREQARRIAEEIDAQVRRAKDAGPAEAEERIEQLRRMAREAEERGEAEEARCLWDEAEELERSMRRPLERREMVERRFARERPPEPWRDVRPERPEGIRERREPIEPQTVKLERMANELKEVLAVHFERLVDEFRELQMRMERMERELQELRAENERLKRQLHERYSLTEEPGKEARERREVGEREETQVRRENQER